MSLTPTNLIMNSILLMALLFIGGCSSDLIDPQEKSPCDDTIWYMDQDNDGLGDIARTITQCEQPDGYVGNSNDNNDSVVIDSALMVTPGVQQAFLEGTTETPFGFYLFTPLEYKPQTSERLPLLIYLHGGGARGKSSTNPGILNRVLFDGPPKLISKNEWSPSRPMIVVSPQSPIIWRPDSLHEFIAYLINNLHVNVNRIYMTGLSMGGNGTFSYVSAKGSDAYVAAIVPIAGWGDVSTGSQFKDIAVWSFHGDADNVISVNRSIEMTNNINSTNPKTKAKLTIYPGVSHDSWTRTYNGTGAGTESSNYDTFDMDIYDWMLLFEKSK